MDRMEGRRRNIRTVLLLGVGLTVIAVTLFRVPLASVFSLGVLLICPLLMVGMHGGHGGGHHEEHSASADHRRADQIGQVHDDRRGGHLAGPDGDRTFDPGVRGSIEIVDGPREVWRP